MFDIIIYFDIYIPELVVTILSIITVLNGWICRVLLISDVDYVDNEVYCLMIEEVVIIILMVMVMMMLNNKNNGNDNDYNMFVVVFVVLIV